MSALKHAIEVVDDGIVVRGDVERYTAWTKAADGKPLGEWLAELADAAAEEEAERTWPYTLKLRHHVLFGQTTIESLEFRRGRMGDADGIKLREEIPTDDLLKIASRLCNTPVAALKLIDIEDAGEVTSIAMDFYVKYLKAGRTRSR